MELDRPILLLTRPEAASRRFEQTFHDRFGADWPVIVAPLMEIVDLQPKLPEGHFDALVFTSENAAAAYARLGSDRSTPAWCIGERTAVSARNEGFVTRTEGGDLSHLARSIREQGSLRRVLHAHGTHVAGDLSVLLEPACIETVSLVVYHQRPIEPSQDMRSIAAGTTPILLPLFSPRSAALAAQALAGAVPPIWIVAISDAAAGAFPLKTARRVIARQKTAEAMLEGLESLLARR